jgi:predicted nucleotidyltransferase component of viral defense system
MQGQFYADKLYPLQDDVLRIIEKAEVDFYLTGGTALSRCYLMHRYSDDLDLFLNAHPAFKEQSKKMVSLFKKNNLGCTVSTASESFVRVLIERNDIFLKIDFVNDVHFHYGRIEKTEIFSKVDNWRNILSNKICALSRMESKDIVDVLFIANRYEFSWEDILCEAREKDLWVEPLEVCKSISNFQKASMDAIRWISPVDTALLAGMIKPLHDDIFHGYDNSLVSHIPIIFPDGEFLK